jgi:hypothetical protein
MVEASRNPTTLLVYVLARLMQRRTDADTD